MKFKLKRYWWVIVVVAAAGFFGLRALRKQAKTEAAGTQTPAYTAVTVARGSLTTTVDGTGKIKPAATVDISSPRDGKITALLVEAGDYVGRGQVLARIDTTSTSVQLLQMEANVNEAQLTVTTAKNDYDRQQRLFAAEAATQQQVDAAKVKYENALAALKVAQAQLAEMRGKAGNGTGTETVIAAPVAGVITQVSSAVGQSVSARIPFMSMTDPGTLVLEADVDENDIAQVKVGQKADITLDALPDLFCPGKVTAIGGLGTEQGGIVTFKISIEFANPGHQIKIGMNADARIIILDRRNIITIPNSALETRMGRTVVRIYERDGGTTFRPVTTGLRTDSVTEIVDGLAEGERVAVPAAKISAMTDTSNPNADNNNRRRGGNMFFGPMGR